MRRATSLLGLLLVCGAAHAEPGTKVDLELEVARAEAVVRDPAAFRADNAAAWLRSRYEEL